MKEPKGLESAEIPIKNKLMTLTILLGTWALITLVTGIIFMNSTLSRILGFFGIPVPILLIFCIIYYYVSKARKTRNSSVFVGMDNANYIPDNFTKDLILSFLTIIPAWVIQVSFYNLLACNSRVHTEAIGSLLEANPFNPISSGMLLMLGIFYLAVLTMSSIFRGSFSFITGNLFDNTAHKLKKRTKIREFLRFFIWIPLMLLYSLFVGIIILYGSLFYNFFMPNPPVNDIDFYIELNDALMLVFALIGVVAMLLQQVLEKLFRSYNKSVLITALVLLSFFMNIAPRPF